MPVYPNAKLKAVGTVAALPSTGTMVVTGDYDNRTKTGWMRFTLTSAVVVITDDTTNGAYSALKLFDFNAGWVTANHCVLKVTGFESGAGVSGAADLSGLIGVGTVALAAAQDNALANATDDNFVAGVAIDETGFTSVTGDDMGLATINGSSTAADLVINFAAAAADADATGTITLSGWVEIHFSFLPV